MSTYMDGQTSERADNGWMDGWIHEYMGEKINRWKGEWVDE